MQHSSKAVFDWLIVGGGIHGVHVAARLVGQVGVPVGRVAIVDPADQLLATWRRLSARTGMRYLRSPVVHHLGLGAYCLRQFPGRGSGLVDNPFAAPYDRPSLELFDSHCDWVVDSFNLKRCHVRDRVASIEIEGGPAVVRTDSGRSIRARHVVLALGPARPALPAWARSSQGEDARVQHVFADDLQWPESPERVLVVGGGITAAQIALRLASEGHAVTFATRHDFRVKQFDSEPGWLGPRNMRGFNKLTCYRRRRDEIVEARHRGSMPHDVHRPLRAAIAAGTIERRRAAVAALGRGPDLIAAALDDGTVLDVDRVLLATGFEGTRPGGRLVDDLVKSANLPCADCGFPIVDRALRWHPRVFVTGALAELELGPTSRNISGARSAGDRIAKVASRWADFPSRSRVAEGAPMAR